MTGWDCEVEALKRVILAAERCLHLTFYTAENEKNQGRKNQIDLKLFKMTAE